MNNEDLRSMQLDSIRSLIGSQIKDARKAKKMTQSELAKYLDVDSSTVSKYESGDRDVPLAAKIKLESLFDILLGVVEDTSKETIPLQFAYRDDEVQKMEYYEAVDIPPIFSREDPSVYGVKVDSEVLNRVIPNGANAIISPKAKLKDGNIAFIEYDGNLYLRRIFNTTSRIILEADTFSDLDIYEPIIIRNNETVNIYGVCVGYVSDVAIRP
ncbi:helix-turn-helix domain-containing protein [Enterococcus avium]|uniref:helix-turn-helix domain-containing protein n=1 Tax=Enterococcus avium TaxID=33945 RepID=UPI003D6A22DC